MAIPGHLVAYWISKGIEAIYASSYALSKFAYLCVGLQTGNNAKYVRFWDEVSIEKLCLNATDYINAFATGKKWFPYNKGGNFRRWYGNNDCVVNWYNNGQEIRNETNESGNLAARPQNTEYYFRRSISWSKISSGKIAFRYKPTGHIFDVAGTSLFCDDQGKLWTYLALLNTKLVQYILEITSPTLNYEVGQVSLLPVVEVTDTKTIEKLVEQNIDISKHDWDSFETSWDFKKHPLI